MASLTHREKISMARKMRTPREAEAGVPIFQSAAWERRKAAILLRTHGIAARTAPAPTMTMAWYEQWIPFYIMHVRGIKLSWYQYVRMQAFRMIHFVFFRNRVNRGVKIKTA